MGEYVYRYRGICMCVKGYMCVWCILILFTYSHTLSLSLTHTRIHTLTPNHTHTLTHTNTQSLIRRYEATDGLAQAVGMLLVPWVIVEVIGEYVDVRWLFIGYLSRAAHFLLFALSPNTAFTFCLVPILLLAR